jgi:short-subunit dehydrogenase
MGTVSTKSRPLAMVTGASTGIGYELARCAVDGGYDVVICADEPAIRDAASRLSTNGARVLPVEADLATPGGVEGFYAAAQGRPVSLLMANAGRGLGKSFLDQGWKQIQRVIDTNVTGTLYLIHKVGRDMRARGGGKILITGSIAGLMPGTFQAVYNGTKALLDSFAYALRAELADSGVTVTCLMVGTEKKQPADEVARAGFQAMLNGDGDVVTGWNNKLPGTTDSNRA